MRARPRYPFVAPTLVFILASVIGPGCPSFAAAPKAVLLGPATVETNQDIVLRFTGTITDSDIKLKLEKAPDTIPLPIFSQNGKPHHALTRATKKGVYQFSLLATGVPEGSKETDWDTATLTVNVVDPGENPNPNPPPNPNPNPNPNPYPPPAPPPPSGPDAAIVAATRAYLVTLPAAYAATADAIDSGKITDVQGAFASLQAHAQPLANALNSAIRLSADGTGKLTRPSDVSAILRSVGNTLASGGK